MADGWAVEVTMKVVGGGESKQIYHAHIQDPRAAEEAVRRYITATPDVRVEAKKPVAHNAFVGANIPEGQVGQWV
jgi:hypothetical protein